MTTAKYYFTGTLSDLTRELTDASRVSTQKAQKISPNASLDRIMVMLTFILGVLGGLIAWGNGWAFGYGDLGYLLAFLALYAILRRLLGRAGFLCALGSIWVLASGASSVGYAATYLWVPAAMTCVGLQGVMSYFFVGVVPNGAVDLSKLDLALDILNGLAERLDPAHPLTLELDLRCPHRKPHLTWETSSEGFFNYLPPYRGRWTFSQPWMTLKVDHQVGLSVVREVEVIALSSGIHNEQVWTETGRDLIEVQAPSRPSAQMERPLTEVRTRNGELERSTLTRVAEPWPKAEFCQQLQDWSPTTSVASCPKLQVTKDATQFQHGIPAKFRGVPQGLFVALVVLIMVLGIFLKAL